MYGPLANGGGDLVDATTLARMGEVSMATHDDATLRADYGASHQVLRGASEIAAQAVLSSRLAAHSTPVLIDGRPGVAAVLKGRVVSLMRFRIDADDRITALEVLADPIRLGDVEV